MQHCLLNLNFIRIIWNAATEKWGLLSTFSFIGICTGTNFYLFTKAEVSLSSLSNPWYRLFLIYLSILNIVEIVDFSFLILKDFPDNLLKCCSYCKDKLNKGSWISNCNDADNDVMVFPWMLHFIQYPFKEVGGSGVTRDLVGREDDFRENHVKAY